MDARTNEGWCWIVLIHILAQIIGCYGYANKSVSACFDVTKTIQLQCDPGYMVRIIQTFYGYSHTGHCTFKDGDCKLAEKEHYSCIGRQSCVINLPSGSLGKEIPGCNKKRSMYFQADYQCIKATHVYDICATSEINQQSGYIRTPRYPRNYPNNKDCTIKIKARKYQTWKVDAVDSYLPGVSSKGCDDKMYISDSTKSLTFCGNRFNDRIFTTYQNNTELQLQFVSNVTGQMKGVWLYFEAIPLLPTPAPPTTTSALTTQKEDTTRTSGGGIEHSSNKPVNTDNIVKEKQQTGLPYPAAAIIGGVIGGLLFILAILVILLMIKRIRERKQIKSSRSDLNTKRKTSNTQQIQNNMGVCLQNDSNPSYYPNSHPSCNQTNNANNHAQFDCIRMENINSQSNCVDGPAIIVC